MEATKVLVEREKIYDQVEKIRTSAAAAEQELKAANVAYGEAIAANSLGECAEATVDEARARVEQARIEVDGFDAALTVLSARVLSSDAELARANEELRREIQSLVNARHEELDVEFAAAVDGVAEVLRRMTAVASAAGVFGRSIDRVVTEVELKGTNGLYAIHHGKRGLQRISELAGRKDDQKLVKTLRPLVELHRRVAAETASIQQNRTAEA